MAIFSVLIRFGFLNFYIFSTVSAVSKMLDESFVHRFMEIIRRLCEGNQIITSYIQVNL